MAPNGKQRVFVVFGTRPEAIKLAPVVMELRRRSDEFECFACSTGQHREMLYQVLHAFHITPDIEMDVMRKSQTLGGLTARLFANLDNALSEHSPDLVIVQGDTSTAMVGGVSAFYREIKVAHVEAGLRTYNRWAPFPEEINRTFISRVADLHFAPTEQAAENLRREGTPDGAIFVTGNTGIDALLWMNDRVQEIGDSILPPEVPPLVRDHRMILVTAHRRESLGEGLDNTYHALRRIADSHPDVVIVFPIHLNPLVREPARRVLGDHPRICLLEPLAYDPFVYLMGRSYCILSDSGGIQEEAPSLGKPVLVTRETTERPEAVEAGTAKLVGTDLETIVREIDRLLTDQAAYDAMAHAHNPYGDGKAAQRIADECAGLARD